MSFYCTSRKKIRTALIFTACSLVFYTLLLFLSANASAEFYKCVHDDGSATYSNTGCPSGTVREAMELPELEESQTIDDTSEAPAYDFMDQGSGVELELITEGYRISEKDRRYIEDGVRFLYRYYDRIFGFEDDVKVKVRIFGKYKRYLGYEKEVTDTRSDAGFYSPMYNECVINGERERAQVLATVFHEASHAILTQTVPTLPLWINEGLAEYFERLELEDGGMVIRHQDDRFYNLRYRLGNKKLLSLNSYFELNDDTRSMAWSILHYLMSTGEGQDSIFAMLRDMEKNPGLSSVEIIDRNYKGGTEQLQKDWLSYLRKNPTVHIYENI